MANRREELAVQQQQPVPDPDPPTGPSVCVGGPCDGGASGGSVRPDTAGATKHPGKVSISSSLHRSDYKFVEGKWKKLLKAS